MRRCALLVLMLGALLCPEAAKGSAFGFDDTFEGATPPVETR